MRRPDFGHCRYGVWVEQVIDAAGQCARQSIHSGSEPIESRDEQGGGHDANVIRNPSQNARSSGYAAKIAHHVRPGQRAVELWIVYAAGHTLLFQRNR